MPNLLHAPGQRDRQALTEVDQRKAPDAERPPAQAPDPAFSIRSAYTFVTGTAGTTESEDVVADSGLA